MSFQQPLLLLALLLLPLGVAAYLAAERRRRRQARAFSAPATAPSVVPRRPGWRRHAPPALAALALTGLLTALARPQVSVAVPAEQASIVLAMDHSGSMQATDVAPSRMDATVAAGETFLDEVPVEVRVGGVVFDHRAEAVQAPTTDRAALRQALREAMRPSGGTATGDALATSLTMLRAQAQDERRPPAAVVLLSDGAATHGRDPLPVADGPAPWASPSTPSPSAPPRARCPTASACPRTPRRCGRSPSAPAVRRSPPSRPARSARSTRGSAPRSPPSARPKRSPRPSPAERCCCSAPDRPCRSSGSAACSELSLQAALRNARLTAAAMRVPSSLRHGTIAAVIATGLALFGSALQGVARMDTSLELAASRATPDRALVQETGDCPHDRV